MITGSIGLDLFSELWLHQASSGSSNPANTRLRILVRILMTWKPVPSTQRSISIGQSLVQTQKLQLPVPSHETKRPPMVPLVREHTLNNTPEASANPSPRQVTNLPKHD